MEGTNQNVKENDEITIDLTELFMTLWSKAHMIILAGILLGLLAFVGTKLVSHTDLHFDDQILCAE